MTFEQYLAAVRKLITAYRLTNEDVLDSDELQYIDATLEYHSQVEEEFENTKD